ncbi:hypothetical protein V6X63_10135 [Spiribacter sp. 221]|uniref:hypothetical protein n=1 Tax=Spiribacter onubensis TaxID=3122420 RepID=UPI00349F06EE
MSTCAPRPGGTRQRRRGASRIARVLIGVGIGLAAALAQAETTYELVVDGSRYTIRVESAPLEDIPINALEGNAWWGSRDEAQRFASASSMLLYYAFQRPGSSSTRTIEEVFYDGFERNTAELRDIPLDQTRNYAIQQGAPTPVPEINGAELARGLFVLTALGLLLSAGVSIPRDLNALIRVQPIGVRSRIGLPALLTQPTA